MMTMPHPLIRSTRSTTSAVLAFGLLCAGLLTLSFQPLLAREMRPQPIKWSQLNLNNHQTECMSSLDAEWRKTYLTLHPRIQRDKQALRHMLMSPNANEQKVLALETRIQQNEQKLRRVATHTFMQKCKQLSPDQRARIQRMMDSAQ